MRTTFSVRRSFADCGNDDHEMWLLECLRDSSDGAYTNSVMWIIGYAILGLGYVLVFIFGVHPIIRHRATFSILPRLQRATRICALTALFLEAISDLFSIFAGRSLSGGTTPWRTALGFALLEFPPYVIDTVYCLALLTFLSICFQDTPNRYIRTLRRTKIGFILYNTVCYALFILSFLAEGADWFGPATTLAIVVGSFTVARDFALCLLFVVFVLVIRRDMGQEGFANPSTNELKLVWASLALSICALTRGVFTLVEAVALRSETNECQTGFYIWFLLNEIVVEGVPQAVLIWASNDYLEQSAQTFGMHTSLLSQRYTM
jgi:hypothetical protein